MKAHVNLQYLAELFLEYEMFHTKVVQTIKTYIAQSIFFFQKINAVYEMRKTMVQITQSTERMQYACQITKARIQTHTLIFYIDC